MSREPNMTSKTESLNATPKLVEYKVSDGLTLRGDAWGDETGRPVLLLHGGGQTRHAWGSTAKVLAEVGFYAVAIDLRGHGESDWHKSGDYQIESYLADIEQIATSFSEPPVLVGASLGGILSLLLEGESGRHFARAIVLVDVATRFKQGGIERIKNFMESHLDGFDTLDEAADAVAKYLPHRSRPDDVNGLKKNLRKTDDGRYRWHWDPAMIMNFKIKKTSNPDRLLEAAKRISIPLLFVRGMLSDVVTPEIMSEFLAVVPQAQHVEIPDAGHTVPGDSNSLFTEAILQFMQSLK